MAVETCMCGRILAQKGETCAKDDTVKPADPGNKKKSFCVYLFLSPVGTEPTYYVVRSKYARVPVQRPTANGDGVISVSAFQLVQLHGPYGYARSFFRSWGSSLAATSIQQSRFCLISMTRFPHITGGGCTSSVAAVLRALGSSASQIM